MNLYPKTNLGRRTSLMLAAIASAVALSGTAFAQLKATIKDTSGNAITTQSCTYSSISVDSTGSLVISGYTCATGGTTSPGSTTPPPSTGPGTLAAAFPTGAVNLGDTTGTLAVTITRTGGSSGAIALSYSFGGDSCADPQGAGGHTINFADGDAAPKTIPFTTTQTAATCYFLIGPAYVNGTNQSTTVLSGQSTIWYTLNVPQSAPAPVTGSGTSSSCPTAASTPTVTLLDSQTANLSNSVFSAASGQIFAARLPMLNLSYRKQAVVALQTTSSSPSASVEMWISPCPGADPLTVPALCHVLGGGQVTSLYWLGASTGTLYDNNTCMAPQGTGTVSPYYVNMRYVYTACPAGTLTCGFLGEWIYGAI